MSFNSGPPPQYQYVPYGPPPTPRRNWKPLIVVGSVAVVVLLVLTAIIVATRPSQTDYTVDLSGLPANLVCESERTEAMSEVESSSPAPPEMTATTATIESIGDGRIEVRVKFYDDLPAQEPTTRSDGHVVGTAYSVSMSFDSEEYAGELSFDKPSFDSQAYQTPVNPADDYIELPSSAAEMRAGLRQVEIELDTDALTLSADLVLKPEVTVFAAEYYPGQYIQYPIQVCR